VKVARSFLNGLIVARQISGHALLMESCMFGLAAPNEVVGGMQN
jgi:hypothetical protein